MKSPAEYAALVKKLREETECYPDDCDYCSAEGKCRCQRIGQACDALEELIRPDGKWENNHCSVCGMMPMGDELWDSCEFCPPRFDFFMKYCPNCGARMTTP